MLESIDPEKLISFAGLVMVLVWYIVETRKDLKNERELKNKYVDMLRDIQLKTLDTLRELRDRIG